MKISAALLLQFFVLLCAVAGAVHEFETRQLTDQFFAESATMADLDNDGDQDVIYGPFWFEGPDFEAKHRIYEPYPFTIKKYSNNFLVYADDLDADGWQDILVLGFPGQQKATYWFKNPGAGKKDQLWQQHQVFRGVDNESPVWGDVTGDGKKEILCSIDGQFGLVAPKKWAKPDQPWTFTAISPPNSTGGKFTHGLGYGDVNGDGRQDLLEKSGWWEQPADGGLWKKHAVAFADKGGSQMFAYDFDGDGDNDIITSLYAHGYGFAWYEQQRAADKSITFEQHLIMGQAPHESRYGVAFSQLHAIALRDIDGDGVKDIVTGKRYFAHGGKDPGGLDAPVVYWFRTVRSSEHGADFVPYQIDDQSGVGTDVFTGDLNGDGRMDVITGNKKGCFIHVQTDEPVASPAPVEAAAFTRWEGEAMEGVKGPGKLRPQIVTAHKVLNASGGAQLWWTDAQPGDEATLPFTVPESGTYYLGAKMTTARDYGIFTFSIDGKTASDPIDFYTPNINTTGPIKLLGPLALEKGVHLLSAKVVGKNKAAVDGYMLGIDYLELRSDNQFSEPKPTSKPVGAPAKPTPKPKAKKLKEGNALQAAARSPEEQLAAFCVPEDFIMELIASERDGVANPTSMNFDDAGRLWVTTATEYPRDRDPEIWKKKGRDRIVVIDAPHHPEQRSFHRFAEGLVMPMGVLPYKNGAFVLQGPELFFLSDENGDGTSDKKRLLLQGFGVQDTHTLPHQLEHAPGGRLVFSQGVLTTGTVVDTTGKRTPFDKSIIATITPQGEDLKIIGVGMNNIWAWAHDRLGRVFIHEANDLGYSLVQFEEDSSYPSFRQSLIHPDAPLHPPTAQGLNLGGTGFSGIAICDDRANTFAAPWQGKFFVANPITGSINCVGGTLNELGVWSFSKLEDLVTCEDPMFRPVAVCFGPDGCLYILDWYNSIISHNEVDRNHPARDRSHGRIWRVRHRDQRVPTSIVDFTTLDAQALVFALNSDSTWATRAAWHQIAERQDASLAPALNTLVLSQGLSASARIHAIWSLESLGQFDAAVWEQLLADTDVNIRREAVRALKSMRVPPADAAPLLDTLANETQSTVRYEVLRYFREADGHLPPATWQWLKNWRVANPPGKTIKGWKGLDYLQLDGSYQAAFQNFLVDLVETKTQLPVIPAGKWDRVLAAEPPPENPADKHRRIQEIIPLVAGADVEAGRAITQSLCLSCHALGETGVGFAPPLNGAANKDVEGLLTAIVDPDAAMENVFRAYRILKKDGATLEGFFQGETKTELTLVGMGGIETVVPINEIKGAGYINGRSAMLDVTAGMTAQQVADIVAYLRTVE